MLVATWVALASLLPSLAELAEPVVQRADFGLTLLVYALLTVASDLLIPKPEIEDAKPAELGDFSIPTATEDRVVPLLWGTCKVSGPNAVWYGDFVQEPITEKVKTGLFSSQKVVRGYRYYLGIQMAFCEGPVDELLEIVIGDDSVVSGNFEHGDQIAIDASDLFGGEELGQGGVTGIVEFFSGTDDQLPSTYLSAFQKAPPSTGDTPAYRNTCYIAPLLAPIYLGTSPQIRAWGAVLRRTPNGISLTMDRHIVNDGDANPACVVYEYLTNTDWGRRIDPSEVDVANLVTAGNTLFSEGNGFSMVLDRPEEVGEMLKRLTAQTNSIVFQNRTTGKWQMRLVRDDYVLSSTPILNRTNTLAVTGLKIATWEGTVNQVATPFTDRADNWKISSGFAQDMANSLIVGRVNATEIRYPGVKDADLASKLAWRELQLLARPFLSGDWIVNRTLYDVLPGDVVRVTREQLGLEEVPMRVRSVEDSELTDGAIRLSLVQESFAIIAPSFAPPPETQWVPPADEFVAFPADEQLAFEAPRAFTVRDPDSSGVAAVDRVWASARRQGNAVQFRIRVRHDAGTPTGDFEDFGAIPAFCRIGELSGSLAAGSAYPLSSLTIMPSPDTQSALETFFPDVADLVELGTELLTLCMVDEEFFLVTSAQTSGANVQLNGVYRGVLDSVQAAHASGAPVYLLFLGGGLGTGSVPAGDNVEVKLLPQSSSDLLDEADATTISFTMADRTRRPYAPASFALNGTTLDTTNVDLDGSGTGENVGVLVDAIVRRDFRTMDEVAALLTDAATLSVDFPVAYSNEVEVRVLNGVTQLTITTGITGTSTTVRQLDILEGLDTTSLPASLTFAVRQSHTFEGTVYKSRQWLSIVSTIVSDMVGQHAFGTLDQADVSTTYLVQSGDDTTDHAFTLSSAFSVGNVEYRLDGGSWTTLISAGGTSGSIPHASLIVGTQVQVRHGSTDVDPQKLLRMTVGGTLRAYGVLIS